MRIPVSAQSTKELEVISSGVAVMLLVLLHWDLVVYGTCFNLNQREVHQLGGKSRVQALFPGYVFLQVISILVLHAVYFFWLWVLLGACLFYHSQSIFHFHARPFLPWLPPQEGPLRLCWAPWLPVKKELFVLCCEIQHLTCHSQCLQVLMDVTVCELVPLEETGLREDPGTVGTVDLL
jgi:hypothetical protein